MIATIGLREVAERLGRLTHDRKIVSSIPGTGESLFQKYTWADISAGRVFTCASDWNVSESAGL